MKFRASAPIRRLHLLAGTCLLAAVAPLHSGEVAASKEPVLQEAPVRPRTIIDSNFDFVAPTKFTGSTDAGTVTIFSSRVNLREELPVSQSLILTGGLGWESVWFGVQDSVSVIPNQVQSVNGSLGFRYRFLDKWSIAVSGTAGLYSDFADIGWEDVNFDGYAYVGYQFCENLYVFAGVALVPDFQIPVLPAAGVRWKINDQWMLNVQLPKPTLEYEFVEGWKVYAFGQLAGGTFRVAKDFGEASGESVLNNKWMSYLDIRAGGGLAYTWNEKLTFRAEVGSSLYRNIEYGGTDFGVDAGPAAFASAGLSVKL